MRTFKVERPTQEYIEQAIAQAKIVNKRQLELLENSDHVLRNVYTTTDVGWKSMNRHKYPSKRIGVVLRNGKLK